MVNPGQCFIGVLVIEQLPQCVSLRRTGVHGQNMWERACTTCGVSGLQSNYRCSSGAHQLLEATLLTLGSQDLVQLVSIQECPIWHAQDTCDKDEHSGNDPLHSAWLCTPTTS